jgi:hypothetical protein
LDRAETLPEDSRGICLCWDKLLMNRSSGRTSYLSTIIFLQEYDNLFWKYPSSIKILNGLQHNFLVIMRFTS